MDVAAARLEAVTTSAAAKEPGRLAPMATANRPTVPTVTLPVGPVGPVGPVDMTDTRRTARLSMPAVIQRRACLALTVATAPMDWPAQAVLLPKVGVQFPVATGQASLVVTAKGGLTVPVAAVVVLVAVPTSK